MGYQQRFSLFTNGRGAAAARRLHLLALFDFDVEIFDVRCATKNVPRRYLDLNQLAGTLPTELGMLAALTTMKAQENALTGSIPTELGLLTRLTSMWISNNAMERNIPSELGSMAAMEHLVLQYNHLSGTIPTELGRLTTMVRERDPCGCCIPPFASCAQATLAPRGRRMDPSLSLPERRPSQLTRSSAPTASRLKGYIVRRGELRTLPTNRRDGAGSDGCRRIWPFATMPFSDPSLLSWGR